LEQRRGRLLAAVLDFMQSHPDAPVVLITHDDTSELKALHLGIHVQQLPDRYALAEEAAPLEIELRQVKAKLARFATAEPVLDLRDTDDEKHRIVSLPK
jgi:hypothetical protein